MAYVRVPTGMKTVTITASRMSYIKYQCCKCGKITLHEYKLEHQESGSYHAFQSKETKKKVEDDVRKRASQALERMDSLMFRRINNEHGYELISKKIKCPYCGEVQPWSNIPGKKNGILIAWGILLFYLVLGTILAWRHNLVCAFFLTIFTVLVALFPLFRNLRRKQAFLKIEGLSVEPPIYYNRLNIGELLSQPSAKKETE